MKEPLYSLEDREFAFLLQKVGEQLVKSKVDYAVVGGVAAQIQTVGAICSGEKKPLEDLILMEQISERKNLRRTNDLDIIIDTPDVLPILEGLTGETTTSNDIFTVQLERRGIKRPIYIVKSLNGEARISLNISNGPRDLERLFAGNYYIFLHEAEDVEFSYEDLHPKIRVLRPEHIIATKLTRYNPKDQFDICNLIDLSLKYDRELNIHKIADVLGVPVADLPECKPVIESPTLYSDRFDLFKAELEQRQKTFKSGK